MCTVSLPDPGIPLPTPILHNVTSGDIRDNGDDITRNVTLRWTLSEPDDCLSTIHFNVTPDDSTHCGSCEVGPGDPGVQEEFSCQVMQRIGQSCTYRVYAVRCGYTQNRVPSEPVEVHVPGMIASYPAFPTQFFILQAIKIWGLEMLGTRLLMCSFITSWIYQHSMSIQCVCRGEGFITSAL